MVEDREKMIYGTEEAVAKLIMEMLKTEKGKVKLLSDLNEEEIGVLSLLASIGEQLNIEAINKFCENFCQFRVSRKRLGRREMTGIATFTTMEQTEVRKRRGIKDLFTGFR